MNQIVGLQTFRKHRRTHNGITTRSTAARALSSWTRCAPSAASLLFEVSHIPDMKKHLTNNKDNERSERKQETIVKLLSFDIIEIDQIWFLTFDCICILESLKMNERSLC